MSADLTRSTPRMGPHAGASRPPRTVVNGVRLVSAGAALELAPLITVVATVGSVKPTVLSSHPAV